MSDYKLQQSKCFICRTNMLIDDYIKGNVHLEATALLNCLNGLIVIPYEKHKDCFDDSTTDISSPIIEFFDSLGDRYNSHRHNYSELDIIRRLRNAIAHFNIKTSSSNGKISGFEFYSYRMKKECPTTGENCSYYYEVDDTHTYDFETTIALDELRDLGNIIKDIIIKHDDCSSCYDCNYNADATNN